MAKEIPQHLDLLGNPIVVGACVVFSYHNSLRVGIVLKLTPKMVQLKRVGANRDVKYMKYPTDLVVLNSQDVTMYLLKAGER